MADSEVKVTKRKVCVVGDGACGKTCLLGVFTKGEFFEDYVPTVFENTTASITVDDRPMDLELWDTAGQEDYDRLRPLSYLNSHAVIICFSVDNPDSLENVVERWVPEVAHFCPHQPFVLVGCKTDLRGDAAVIDKLEKQKQHVVTYEEGLAASKKTNAFAYVECSARNGDGVMRVFEQASRACLKQSGSKKRICQIL